MIKKILIGLGCVLAILVIVIATRPADFRIERSAQMAAPPAVVYEQVADFHRWADWSPWDKLDPTMKKTFSGAESGTGAAYHWVGEKDVGEGRMTIAAATPPQRVEIKLEFIKPFAATNTTTFTFTPEAGGTKVSWLMEGQNNFMSKAFSLFMNVDAMVGKDFEKGLAQLKEISETEAKRRAAAAAQAPAPTPAPAPAPATP